ncbi:hypothetical protein M3P19_04265 [Muricauda sp. 2012CJ35-5]|uniref:Macroglobulin domain-containing protein n=1 Tax=Flagellimonas spongiicola TaxID=2942208 RepID=A0ABT0PRW7_9FLAO|nr:hypothetical protein [Allomuricauda spongiicola]MCL6273208.1 hypothetical protein [Allomuricauda spongiicola]
MRYSIITLFTALIVTVTGWAQSANSNQNDFLTTIPQEKVFVQYNESLLFSGEPLLYKLYSLDAQKRKLTTISKIGYVSLVDKNGNTVFTHKVRLTNGAGYGDFFVPTSIPTGSYKLLGYTQWMKNFGSENFFQSDIHIINPYQPIPEEYLAKPLDSMQMANQSRVKASPNVATTRTAEAPIQVSLDKESLGQRERLTVNFTTSDENLKAGNYALSIRKMDGVDAPNRMGPADFVSQYLNKRNNANGSGQFSLPELRGEVLSGTITNKDSNTPAADVRVSLSLPGDNYLFNVATSDQNGRFRFLLDQEYDNVTAAFQVLADNWDDYEITMDEAQKRFDNLNISELEVSESLGEFILQKSIENQIENGFRAVKSDSVLPAVHEQPFYRKFTVDYNLDDYTRFNSIQETIIEVVDQLSVRRLDNGERAFEIRPEQGFTDLALLPMVFVDGLFIKKHEDFMDYSAKKIQRIRFSREKVILGPQVFQGVLHFETIEGDFYSDFYTPHIVNQNLFKPQTKKIHFNQGYGSGANQSRVPDFRHQLLWEPNLDLSAGNNEVSLYTSDVAGTYLLILEGFSSTGTPVSVKRQFKVQ